MRAMGLAGAVRGRAWITRTGGTRLEGLGHLRSSEVGEVLECLVRTHGGDTFVRRRLRRTIEAEGGVTAKETCGLTEIWVSDPEVRESLCRVEGCLRLAKRFRVLSS